MRFETHLCVPLARLTTKNKHHSQIGLLWCSFLARLMRFERTTHSVGGYCSIQLSYRRKYKGLTVVSPFSITYFIRFCKYNYLSRDSVAAIFTATQNTSIAFASSASVGYVGAIRILLSWGSLP